MRIAHAIQQTWGLVIRQPSEALVHGSDAATEPIHIAHLLDVSPWSILQKSVVLLSALTIIFDGMDIQMMGFAVPAIAKDRLSPFAWFRSTKRAITFCF